MGSLAPEGPVGAHAAARHGHVTALATLAEAAGPWPLVPPRPARPAEALGAGPPGHVRGSRGLWPPQLAAWGASSVVWHVKAWSQGRGLFRRKLR